MNPLQANPHLESFFDTTTAKIFRIVVTAFLFSQYHSINTGTMSAEPLENQINHTFFLGLICGFCCEYLGLMGANSS